MNFEKHLGNISFLSRYSAMRVRVASFVQNRLIREAQHTTVSRTSLDEGSTRRRDIYLTTQHSQEAHPCLQRNSNPKS